MPFGWVVRALTCVHFALRSLLADRPVALVVSGINHGQNLGRDISSSGTVGAARMAAEIGVPAIAFSISHGSREFGAAAIPTPIPVRIQIPIRKDAGGPPALPGAFLTTLVDAPVRRTTS